MSRKTELAAKIEAALVATAPEGCPARMARVVELINASLFSTIGVRATYSIYLADLRIFCRLGEFEINPLMCGPMGAMFAAIRVTVTCGIGPTARQERELDAPPKFEDCNGLFMRYAYRYTHPGGGSNGHTVDQVFEIAE